MDLSGGVVRVFYGFAHALDSSPPKQDLKPENFLFLSPEDDSPIKIIDFGLSRHDDAALGIMQTKVGSKLRPPRGSSLFVLLFPGSSRNADHFILYLL